jgi:hypothetical protein
VLGNRRTAHAEVSCDLSDRLLAAMQEIQIPASQAIFKLEKT